MTLSDGLLDTLVDYVGTLPTAECEIFIGQLGGATNRVPADATAYPHRDANFVMNVHTRWRERSDEQASIKWARALFAATAPHATGGVYVNFMPEDETDRVAGAYGGNYARLLASKGQIRSRQFVSAEPERPPENLVSSSGRTTDLLRSGAKWTSGNGCAASACSPTSRHFATTGSTSTSCPA